MTYGFIAKNSKWPHVSTRLPESFSEAKLAFEKEKYILTQLQQTLL